ncbi:MAG: methyltransferase domain-containing protein [Nanohaloarchaea archaeon]|nr:methyltransferase domain-containing protein [Candidatus Nanohaloarchaea archaeon]
MDNKSRNDEKIKKEVRKFWNSSPCGTFKIKEKEGTLEYFKEIDDYRYNRYPYCYGYIYDVIGFSKYKGKKVLEVGCSVGTDLSQFAKHGAIVTGIDLTPEGIRLAKERFKTMGLKGTLKTADAENLPFDDNSFDIVYSFGVLHHTPNTQKTIDEVYRVLKKGGEAKIMLYHKNSFETLTHIVRKIKNPSRWKWSLQKAINYQTEMNRDSEGVTNPLTKVYSKSEVKKMFKKFKNVDVKVYWLRIPFFSKYTPEWLVYPLSRTLGWHLIIKAKK